MSSRYISQIRTAVINELDKPYVNGARARGVSEDTILIRSVLKSAMLTVSTLLALSAGRCLEEQP